MVMTKYRKRISGPLLDYINIHLEVPRVEYEKLSGRSMQLRYTPGGVAQVLYAGQDEPLPDPNSHEPVQSSARADYRVLNQARTIADSVASESIQPPHLAEALQYRLRLSSMG